MDCTVHRNVRTVCVMVYLWCRITQMAVGNGACVDVSYIAETSHVDPPPPLLCTVICHRYFLLKAQMFYDIEAAALMDRWVNIRQFSTCEFVLGPCWRFTELTGLAPV